jgi:hypothetical protein
VGAQSAKQARPPGLVAEQHQVFAQDADHRRFVLEIGGDAHG